MASNKRHLSSEIADLNAVINAAACDVNLWIDVAEALQAFIPGSKILFQVVEEESETVLQVVYSGFANKTIQAYGDHYWKLNPWTKGTNDMRMSSLKSSLELYPDELLRKTEFFNDLVKPERECDVATALKFAAHKDRYALLAVHHDFRRHDRTHARSLALLQTIVPALRTALEVNRLTNPAFHLPGGRGLIDQLVDPAMVLDQDCRLLASNGAANGFLKDARFLRVKARDVVEIKNCEANAAFSRLVRDNCSVLQGRTRPSDLVVSDRSGSYTVTSVPMAIDQTSALPAGLLSIFTPKTVAMVIVRPRANEDPSTLVDDLQRHFRLTKSEAGLILEFERGGTLSEIADRTGVSRSTIQTHLKAIFAKTGTSKQRDVVTLVTRHRGSGKLFSVED